MHYGIACDSLISCDSYRKAIPACIKGFCLYTIDKKPIQRRTKNEEDYCPFVTAPDRCRLDRF